MEKYLIALDLDGTLLNAYGKLSNYTIETIKKIKELGHLPLIATGRPYHASKDFHQILELNTPLISDNGGSIRHPNDKDFVPLVKRLDLKVAHAIFKKARPYLISAFFSDNDHIYAYKDSEYLRFAFQSDGVPVTQVIFDEIDIAPTGMVYLIDVKFKDEFETMLETEFKDKVQYRVWGYDYKHALYELYVPNISKASAIDIVAKKYSIPHDHIIAFGDGVNDLEMLKFAKIGVTMKNAHEEVRNITSYQTEFNNDEDGVAKHLKLFLDLKD